MLCDFFCVISGSLAAIVLLDSIDVGLETAHTDGLQDWDSVKVFIITICVLLDNVIVVLDAVILIVVDVIVVIVVSNILLQFSFLLSCQCPLFAT